MSAPPLLLALQDAAEGGAFGTMEFIFLGLFGLFTLLYWRTYSRDENVATAALKVAGLLAFVYVVIRGFDWLAAPVTADQVITLGISEAVDGPRVPLLASALEIFVVVLLVLVAWHARRKFTTVGGLFLSAWDRGHWYMLPAIFILMTVGLLLVAAAASPVLSPFIYTLF